MNMKVSPTIFVYTTPSVNNNNSYYAMPFNMQNDVISFTSKDTEKSQFKRQRFFNKLLNKKLCNVNLDKLEGVQEGLKTFDGLSMKQIAFALTDLHSINMVSGCTRHCLHCYANAQPFVKRGSYEDLKQICEDIKELEQRTGAKPCYHHGEPYINIGFDTDGLDCHLFDKDGKKYDFVDIAKMLYSSIGYKSVFDTNGWSTKEKQKIAEDYVEKLVENDNYKNFHQINISINPFNPKYVKAIKSGYDVDDLYMPFKKVVLNPDAPDPEETLPEDFKKARDMYTSYVKETANTLITFKPLLKADNFGLIIRAFSNDITRMKGFRTEDFAKTLNHIVNQLTIYKMCGEITEEECSLYWEKLSRVSNRIFTSGRMEKFYNVTNGSLVDIEGIDISRVDSAERVRKLKETKKLSSAQLRYLKMISADGKVYAYDNYAIIPTNIQLNTSTKNLQKPFQIKQVDFTLTEDMIDIF